MQQKKGKKSNSVIKKSKKNPGDFLKDFSLNFEVTKIGQETVNYIANFTTHFNLLIVTASTTNYNDEAERNQQSSCL